ncbi:hypothetical protein [Cohnella kolymensis]|nr:hypothetical protein [Cohnella kolymensis]
MKAEQEEMKQRLDKICNTVEGIKEQTAHVTDKTFTLAEIIKAAR